MRIGMRVLLPLLLCFIVQPAAQAITLFNANDVPVSLSIDELLSFEWHNNHEFDGGSRVLNDDFMKIDNVLSADLRVSDFSLGLRMEGRYYPDKLVLDRRLRAEIRPQDPPIVFRTQVSDDEFRVERYHFSYNGKKLKIDFGDYYATIGRGLALSMRKEVEGELDNSLRGGKVAVEVGDSRATLLAGFSNTINIDPNHETPQADPDDFISALRVEQRLADLFSIGGHAVYAEFGALENQDKRRFIVEDKTVIGGASIDFPDILGYASLYFEGDYIKRYGREVNEDLTDFNKVDDDGYGLYGSFSFYVENFTFIGEYKYFNDFIFRRSRSTLGYNLEEGEEVPEDLSFFEDIHYNDLPTLERTDIETNRSYGNDHGFRLRAEYNVIQSGTVPYVAAYFTINEFQEQGTSSLGGFGSDTDYEGDRIWHIYGGVTQYFTGIEVYVDGGFRDEYSLDAEKSLVELAHVKLGGSFVLTGPHSIAVEMFYLRKDYQLLKELEGDFDLTLSYNFGRYLGLSFLYTMQQKDFMPSAGEDELNHFFAGEVSSSLFDDILRLSVFAGQVRESYRCYGGFCRKVPPFEGVKAKVRVVF